MSSDHVFQVDATLSDHALASTLRRLIPQLPWSQVKRLVLRRRVKLNGVVCADPGQKVVSGDSVELLSPPRPRVPDERDVRILHLDEHLVVVDKPAMMLTTRGDEVAGDTRRRRLPRTLLDEAVARLLARRRDRPDRVTVRIVHRLDRDTSGLMIFALNEEAERRLGDMFSRHDLLREYWAVVHGAIESTMTIESALLRDRGDGLRGSAPQGTPTSATAKRAVTHVEPVERIGHDRYTVIRCRLETGRTHQIRIHLSERGHRLCGERLYTHATGQPSAPDASGAPRQALHSMRLHFEHPVGGQRLEFNSPLPRDLRCWLDVLHAT